VSQEDSVTASSAARPALCRIGFRSFSLFALIALFGPAYASAQAGNADWDTASGLCQPACRSGYECRRGECTPICSPSCSSGYVCSEGQCVQTEPSTTPAPVAPLSSWRPEPAANSCEPTCRSGYGCVHSRCVSLCNPVCGAGETCNEQGECVLDRLSEPREQPKPLPRERDTSADSLVNLHADVAGALQFGVTPTVEVGKQLSGYLQLRVMNAGLASYLALPRDRDDDFRWGVGAALGVHLFTAERGNMRGVYGGLALEYAYVETRDDSKNFARHRTHALIPQADFGYRWAFGDLLLGVSAKLGLAIPVSQSSQRVGGNGCQNSSCDDDTSLALIPGIVVDLGWFIPNPKSDDE
jgi:hypothetical protein